MRVAVTDSGDNEFEQCSVPSARSRRSRPRSRRADLLVIAAQLFTSRGFDGVTMAEIAAEAGITASALYRHFANKQALLQQVFETVGPCITATTSLAPTVEDVLRTRSVDAAAAPRALWVREGWRLDAHARAVVETNLNTARQQWVSALRHQRPRTRTAHLEFLADAVMALVDHRISLTKGATRTSSMLLDAAVLRVASLPPTDPPSAAVIVGDGRQPTTQPMFVSKRESAINAAMRLFGECGYTAVTMSDIAKESSVSRPTLYTIFPSKITLLHQITDRSYHVFWSMLHSLYTSTSDASTLIGRTIEAYIDLARSQPYIVRFVQFERAADSMLDVRQQEYISEVATVLRVANPHLTASQANVLVRATVSVVNDLCAFDPHGQAASQDLLRVCMAVLDVSVRDAAVGTA
ncbi:TetR/AcrR family transcriptional regulator [Rhodococcus qingshengii]